VVQLTRSGLVVSAAGEDLRELRAQFDRLHCFRLPAFLDADLLSFIQRRLERVEFAERVHDKVGLELCLTGDVTLALLYLVTNDSKLFDLVRQLTGCGRIGCLVGRIYRMIPGTAHYDSWHSDRIGHRMIGLSVNLSAKIFAGGAFQLRDSGSKEILYEIANTGPGDAILFRIADGLEHQITAMEGTVPKTAFAGWFKSEPEFLSLLTSGSSAESAD